MINKNLIQILFLIFLLFWGCSKKQNAPLFTNTVSNQPGTLIFTNPDNFLGSVPIGNTLESRITIRANGGLDLRGLSPTISGDPFYTFKGGSYPGIGGTCGTTLVSGASCDVVMIYDPVAIATNHMTLTFSYVDNVSAKSLSKIFETDSHPILTFEYGTQYNFGNKFVGTSTDLSINLANTGRRAANGLSISNLTAPFSFKGGSYPGTAGTCTNSLPIGQSCKIIINYSPTNNVQHLQDIVLNYSNNGVGEHNTLHLSAWGFFPAVLSLSDSTAYDFGTKVAGPDYDKVYTVTYVSGDVFATSMSLSGLSSPFNFKGGIYPGTGGTCAATLRTGSCTIVLTMSTADSGSWQNNFTFSYHGGITLNNLPRTIKGITKQKPVLAVTPASDDFGVVHTGSTSAGKIFTLTNSGELPAGNIALTGLAAPFAYLGGSFPGTGGTCTTTLNPGSCKVVLSYSPTALSNLSQATVNFGYDDYFTRVLVPITIKGATESSMSFEVSGLDFGSKLIGTQATAYARIYFSGGTPATSIAPHALSAPFAYIGGTYPGTGGTCSTTHSTGYCSIYFIYTPTNSSTHNQTYSLDYFNGLTTQTITINLTGKGIDPAFLTIPATAFGSLSVNSVTNKTITITNLTTIDATSVSPQALPTAYSFKDGTYPGTGGTCSTTVSAGASCTVVITYNPLIAGNNNGNLTMNYNNAVTNTSSGGNLTATAINTNDLFISSSDTVNFGSKYIDAFTDYTFTLYHGGSPSGSSAIAGAALPADYTFAGGTFPGTGGTCGSTLASGNNCSFVVRFAPLSTGTKNASVTINYFNGTINTSVTRLVTGVGLASAILTIPNTDFGTLSVNSVTTKTITITNSTTINATSVSASTLPTGMSFKGGAYPGTGGTCSNFIGAGGGSCTVVITYNPLSAGTNNGNLTMNYYNGNANSSRSASITAVAINTNDLFISSSDTVNFGPNYMGSTTDYSFTLYHGGSPSGSSAIAGAALPVDYTFAGGTFPGTGGTCGSTLASGNSCTFVVRFLPLSAGTKNAGVTINYFNGTINTSVTRLVTGVGLQVAILTIPATGYGTLSVNSVTSKTITITNSTTINATSVSAQALPTGYSFKGGAYPGTGGTCSNFIGAGGSCTVVITYNPLIAGNNNGNLTMNYYNGYINTTGSGSLTAVAVNTNDLYISSSDTVNFGSNYMGSTTDYSFTLYHGGSPSGASAIAGAALPADYTFAGGAFPGTGGTCGSTLASGNNCTFVVRFSPLSAGTKNASVTINYFNGTINTSVTRLVTGVGLQVAILTIPATGYGTLSVNSVTTKTITITNSTTINASTVSAQALPIGYSFSGGAYPGTGGTCSNFIGAGGSCTVVITYNPLIAGNNNGNLTMNYYNGYINTTGSGSLTAVAVNTNDLYISGTDTYYYGSKYMGTSTDYTFTLYHGGSPSGASAITGAALPADYTFAGGAFPGTGGTCGATLASGNSCTFVVRFAPLSTGTKNASVTINYFNGTTNASVTRLVSGIGLAAALLTIPNTDFGTLSVNSITTKTITITNSTAMSATVVSAQALPTGYSFKGGAYPGTGGTCSTSVGSLASCTVVIVYAPLVAGNNNGNLTMNYFNGYLSTTGSGSLTAVAINTNDLFISSSDTYSFGSRYMETNTDYTFTLYHGGDPSGASAIAGAALPADYSFVGGAFPGTGGTCGSTLASGNSCTFVVRFLPLSAGTKNASVTINYFNGTTNASVTRLVTGVGLQVAVLTIPNTDFGTLSVNSVTTKTITITNSTAINATTISAQALPIGYSFVGGAYPGTGGTCSTSLNAGTSCTVAIVYTPLVAGNNSGNLTMNYYNGNANTSRSGGLTAVAINTNDLFISSSDTYYYGSKYIDAYADYTFTLYHGGSPSGASAITGAALPADYTFAGGAFPGTGGTCGSTLASGNTCTFVVRFAPLSTGTKNASVTINYFNGTTNASVTRLVSGVGLAAAILTIPATDFGSLSVNSVTTKTITITNSTTINATTVSAQTLPVAYSFKGGAYPGTGGTCSSNLNAGTSCTVVIVYTPLIAGNNNGNLTMNYYNGNANTSRSGGLTAVAINTNDLFISSSDTYYYGSKYIDAYADYTFTLYHGGSPSGASAITGAALPVDYTFAGGAFPGTGGTCGATLASGNTCTFVVRFSPLSMGTKNASVTINYFNGTINTSVTRLVSGVGLASAILTIPATDFGSLSVNSVTTKTITITNSTTINATSISAQALPTGMSFKGGAYPGAGGTCSTSINAGTSCTVVIVYNPLIAGNNSGNLTLNYYNGNANSSRSGSLTAVAINSNDLFILNSDVVYDFGSKFTGTNTDYAFTLYQGGAPSGASAITGAALPADYTFAGGSFPGIGGTCGSTLASGNSCTFVLRFSPVSAGTKNANVTINYNNGTINTSVARSVTGVGRQQAVITATPNPYNYGLQIIGASYEKVFTLTTTGPETATGRTASFSGSGFSFKGGTYPGTGGTCGAGNSSSCTIVVLFSPVSAIAYSSTLKINYFDSYASVDANIDLTGTGKGFALLSFADASPYNFGKVVQTSSFEASLTLNNSGILDATSVSASSLSAPFSYKGGAYPGTGGTCGTTLVAGGSCTIVAKFSPMTTGISSNIITMNYNNGTSATSTFINLSGEGVAQAVLSISDSNPYNFGSVVVGSSLSKVFTVTNGGGTQSSSMGGNFTPPQFQFKGGAYPGTAGTCGATLAAYASCTIVLSFTPSALEVVNGTFNLTYNDGLGAQTEFKNLIGSGIGSLKVESLLEMIPIQKIEATDPQVFFEEAMTTNGDKIDLSNGSTISGREQLLLKNGLFQKYFTFPDDNVDATSLFSSWGLSKLNIGDINDDLVDDFIVSHFNPNPLPDTNDEISFTCYSGKDLSVLYTITIPNPSHLSLGLSSKMIPQDVDGDGYNDFITGLYQLVDNRLILKDIMIFSSKTGMTIDYSE